MTSPRVSIITPSFNQARFLEQTLRSVLEQGYDNLQYIVVDGGSTDGSADILQRYRDRIDPLIIEPDRGQSDAINKGLRRADGEIVGWLCSDDTLLPGALHVLADHFTQHPRSHWIAAPCRDIDAHGNPLDLQQPAGDFSLAGILLRKNGLRIPQPGVYWRRRLLDEVGLLDESLHHAMDFDLWCRFAAAGYRPDLLAQPIATYRFHDQSKSCTQQLGFLRDHLKIESRLARHLTSGERRELRQRLGYMKRSLAASRPPLALWSAVLAHPWWLGSRQIRTALFAPRPGTV